MNNELVKINHPIVLPDAELSLLADKIVQEIEEGRRALAISISETIKTTYWRIGRHIVEFEQDGNKRAKYGTAMLSNLAKILRARVGRGYSRPNLNNMRKFYLMFPKCQTSDKSIPNFQTSDKLTWSHICELMVEYATYGMDSNLFVSKYELFLPNKDELRKMVRGMLKK